MFKKTYNLVENDNIYLFIVEVSINCYRLFLLLFHEQINLHNSTNFHPSTRFVDSWMPTRVQIGFIKKSSRDRFPNLGFDFTTLQDKKIHNEDTNELQRRLQDLSLLKAIF